METVPHATSAANPPGPHQGQPVRSAGAALSGAKAAVVMVHGRGASAQSILSFAEALGTEGVAYRAPQAAGHTWYPYSFLAPAERNEPGRSSGLRAIAEVLAEVEAGGVPAGQTVLLGFSQGACLALDYAAEHPQRYGGVIAWSGGLIGPQEAPLPSYSGSLGGTPVFLGCSDRDAHIPLARVEETAAVFQRLDAEVTKRIYPGMGHVVNEDEVDFAQALVRSLAEAG